MNASMVDYAVPMTGTALVSINIRLSANEVAYIINHSDAKAVFVDNAFAGTVQPILDQDERPIEESAGLKSRQGVPFVTTQYMDVMDPVSMQPVPRDGQTIGEVVMRGNNVMLCYCKDPEATEKAFAGGWFHSGDLAVMHPDGYVQIMDRKKDIIISGGENISTVEIENVIFRHPEVLEVAVIPVPDEKWGEVPKAFVVPKNGTQPSAQSIIDFCKENLARFKAPKAVEFAQLPKTATGKIQKFKLREKEWQGRERMGN
ncbi:MAG: AMP-binding protein [Desulfobacteraceae bacterium]